MIVRRSNRLRAAPWSTSAASQSSISSSWTQSKSRSVVAIVLSFLAEGEVEDQAARQHCAAEDRRRAEPRGLRPLAFRSAHLLWRLGPHQAAQLLNRLGLRHK